MVERVFERVSRDDFLVVFALLVLVDMILIGLWGTGLVLRHLAIISELPPSFDIANDWALGEIANYAKYAAAAILMIQLWRRTGVAMFAALGFLFLVMLADDAFQVHERGGALIAAMLGLDTVLGLKAQQFTSVAVWGVLGTGVAAGFVCGFLRSPRGYYPLGMAMLAILGGLAFCGVAVDFIGSAAVESGVRFMVVRVLTLIEDGGEMVLVSAACALAVGSYTWETRTRPLAIALREALR